MRLWPFSKAKAEAPPAKGGSARKRPAFRGQPVPRSYTPVGKSTTDYGYRVAERARKSGEPLAMGGSEDSHLSYDLVELRNMSRQLWRDNFLFEAILGRFLVSILGDGITLQARTSSPRVNRQIERLWYDEVHGQPEASGRYNFDEMARHALAARIVDGDVGVLRRDDGKFQLIAAERIRYPMGAAVRDGRRVFHGVEVNEDDRPIYFWVDSYTAHGHLANRPRRIPADDMMFLATRKNFDQSRGVPLLATIHPNLLRLEDVLNSEAASWQMLSKIALAITKENAGDWMQAAASDTTASTEDIANRYFDFGDVSAFVGEKGETVRGIDRTIPGQHFDKAVLTYIKLIGMALGLPVELLLLDWSQTNFSSARASLLQAYRMFTWHQDYQRNYLYRPAYQWHVYRWVRDGRLPGRRDIFDHEWIAPPFPWVDPLKETQALGNEIDRGLKTHAEALKERNIDHEDWMTRRGQEIAQAIARANALNEQYPGASVPWEAFAGYEFKRQAPAPAAPQEGETDDADA